MTARNDGNARRGTARWLDPVTSALMRGTCSGQRRPVRRVRISASLALLLVLAIVSCTSSVQDRGSDAATDSIDADDLEVHLTVTAGASTESFDGTGRPSSKAELFWMSPTGSPGYEITDRNLSPYQRVRDSALELVFRG